MIYECIKSFFCLSNGNDYEVGDRVGEYELEKMDPQDHVNFKKYEPIEGDGPWQ
jgi:hypothetical protein